jgi:hypothetical protein
VDQAVQFPLPSDLRSAAQREAGQPLVVAQGAAAWLPRGEAAGNQLSALGAVELAFHAGGIRLGLAGRGTQQDGYLPHGGLVWVPQTARPYATAPARSLATGKLQRLEPPQIAVVPVAGGPLASRADTV